MDFSLIAVLPEAATVCASAGRECRSYFRKRCFKGKSAGNPVGKQNVELVEDNIPISTPLCPPLDNLL
ncbi:MAG: hypothetical protein VB111_02860 [Clostridiaceae bacterium]|nr:hypothetical protein [Clostridiaceae bacterium]